MIETTMIRSTIKRLLDKSEDDCMPPSIVYWQCDRGGGGSGDRKRRKRKNSLNNNNNNNNSNNKFINRNKNSNYSQRLLLVASLCYCLIIPFSEASASSSMTNFNISNLQPAQPHTVQIFDSYSSSSHVKPGHNINNNNNDNNNYKYSNFSSNVNYTRNNHHQNQTYSPSVYSNNDNNNNNTNNSHKAMRRISFLPKFANLIFPSSSSYTPIANSGSGFGYSNINSLKRRRRVRPTNNNTANNKNSSNKNKNNNNNNNNNKRTKKRKKKPSKVSSGVGQKTRISPNFDSLLFSNSTKPTMHPLRVLQTEITMVNKTQTQSQSQGFPNLRAVSSTIPSFGATISLHSLMNNQYDKSGLNKSNDKYDSNLENHRLVDTIPSVFIVHPNPNPNQFSSPITNGRNSNMIMTVNSEAVTSKPRIPIYVPQNKSKSSSDDAELKDTLQLQLQGNETTTTQTLENSNSSLSPNPTEDAFLSLVNTGLGKSEGRSALMARFSGEESKQLHSPSYFNHINDQIAEEDNHYEVTERFPENYERTPQQHQLQAISESQQHLQQHQQNQHQQQVMQNNHNNNNDYRHTDTDARPSNNLNSYYDANHYSEVSNSHHNYHTNDHRDDFYHHHHNELPSHHGSYPSPEHHHPSGQERHPHPKHPHSFKGEHDLQSADTIMDRFEVFYKEYKLLTWVGFLVVTGLALVCVLAYLYINNPPTEVVTARSKMTEYLRDPSLLKFLHNLLEGEDPFHGGGGKRRRRKKNLTSSQPSSSKAKEL